MRDDGTVVLRLFYGCHTGGYVGGVNRFWFFYGFFLVIEAQEEDASELRVLLSCEAVQSASVAPAYGCAYYGLSTVCLRVIACSARTS